MLVHQKQSGFRACQKSPVIYFFDCLHNGGRYIQNKHLIRFTAKIFKAGHCTYQ